MKMKSAMAAWQRHQHGIGGAENISEKKNKAPA
jgi:hypothetical protein